MAASKFLVALFLALCISSGVMAQNLDPATFAAITAKCGTALGPLVRYGPACYKASGKPMRKCPASCRNLIKSVPSTECSSAIFNASPATNRVRVAKVCTTYDIKTENKFASETFSIPESFVTPLSLPSFTSLLFFFYRLARRSSLLLIKRIISAI
jgi:hypothetical protein